jgi:hypothetical protein
MTLSGARSRVFDRAALPDSQLPRVLRKRTLPVPLPVPAATREIASTNAPRERIRLWLVRLVFAFFLLLPIEGIARKWLLPGLQAPLLLVRDPVAIALLGGYLLYQSPRLARWVALWALAVTITLIVCLFQVVFQGVSVAVILLGLRNYLLFIPVAFVIRDTFRREDMVRFVTMCCWISVPIALLVIVQFFSPAGAWINRGIDADAAVFTVAGGIVRPYGPFTFAIAQVSYTLLVLALLIAGWDRARAWNISQRTLAMGLSAVFVMGALSGARGFFVGAGLIVIAYIGGGLVARNIGRGLLRAGAGILGILAFLTVLIVIFPTSFEAISQRQQTAVASEGSTIDRALSLINPIPRTGPTPTLLGEGLGVGSNAGGFAAAGTRGFALSETEAPRVIQEAGILLGVGFLLYRVTLIISIAIGALRSARVQDSGAGFAMLGFAAPLLLTSQISGQSQLVSIAWFFSGITLSIITLSQPRSGTS